MIGSTLQELIDKKKTNVNELARMIDVSPQTLYSIIKRDNMKIDFEVLLKICKALEVDVEVFYSDYVSHKSTSDCEYPLTAKYRRLNDSGKEYIDSQLDYALSQEKFQLQQRRPPHIPDMEGIQKEAEAFVDQLKNQTKPTKE